ncbi:MAG: hypothetical protein WDN26_21220 [Chitinophagaceae bacterium]
MIAPNSAIQTYGSVGSNRVNSFRTGLVANENLFIKLAIDYFIENKDGEMRAGEQEKFTQIFSSRRKAINDYLDKNQVNFNRGR